MLVLAHIFGMPLEELISPTVGVVTASAVSLLVNAFGSRWKRRQSG